MLRLERFGEKSHISHYIQSKPQIERIPPQLRRSVGRNYKLRSNLELKNTLFFFMCF